MNDNVGEPTSEQGHVVPDGARKEAMESKQAALLHVLGFGSCLTSFKKNAVTYKVDITIQTMTHSLKNINTLNTLPHLCASSRMSLFVSWDISISLPLGCFSPVSM